MSTYMSPHTSGDLARMAGCRVPEVGETLHVAQTRCGLIFNDFADDTEVCPDGGLRHEHPFGQASPGAEFLRNVEYAAREAWEQGIAYFPDNPSSLAWHLNNINKPSEIADAALPADDLTVWQVFTDLGAWREYVREVTAGDEDMTILARQALWMIAHRLVRELIERWV